MVFGVGVAIRASVALERTETTLIFALASMGRDMKMDNGFLAEKKEVGGGGSDRGRPACSHIWSTQASSAFRASEAGHFLFSPWSEL